MRETKSLAEMTIINVLARKITRGGAGVVLAFLIGLVILPWNVILSGLVIALSGYAWGCYTVLKALRDKELIDGCIKIVEEAANERKNAISNTDIT